MYGILSAFNFPGEMIIALYNLIVEMIIASHQLIEIYMWIAIFKMC